VVLESTMSIAQEVIALDRAAQAARPTTTTTTSRGLRPSTGTNRSSHATQTLTRSTGGSATAAAEVVITAGPLLRGVTPALYRLLLHVLTKGQSDLTLITCLEATRKLIQDIGMPKLYHGGLLSTSWGHGTQAV
jgi:hypothetical protein